MKKLNKKGFTLIELIVVIAILAILAAILIPSLTNYLNQAREAKNQSNARSYYTALALFEQTGGSAPTMPTDNDAVADCTGTVAAGTLSCNLDGVVFSIANGFNP